MPRIKPCRSRILTHGAGSRLRVSVRRSAEVQRSWRQESESGSTRARIRTTARPPWGRGPAVSGHNCRAGRNRSGRGCRQWFVLKAVGTHRLHRTRRRRQRLLVIIIGTGARSAGRAPLALQPAETSWPVGPCRGRPTAEDQGQRSRETDTFHTSETPGIGYFCGCAGWPSINRGGGAGSGGAAPGKVNGWSGGAAGAGVGGAAFAGGTSAGARFPAARGAVARWASFLANGSANRRPALRRY